MEYGKYGNVGIWVIDNGRVGRSSQEAGIGKGGTDAN